MRAVIFLSMIFLLLGCSHKNGYFYYKVQKGHAKEYRTEQIRFTTSSPIKNAHVPNHTPVKASGFMFNEVFDFNDPISFSDTLMAKLIHTVINELSNIRFNAHFVGILLFGFLGFKLGSWISRRATTLLASVIVTVVSSFIVYKSFLANGQVLTDPLFYFWAGVMTYQLPIYLRLFNGVLNAIASIIEKARRVIGWLITPVAWLFSFFTTQRSNKQDNRYRKESTNHQYEEHFKQKGDASNDEAYEAFKRKHWRRKKQNDEPRNSDDENESIDDKQYSHFEKAPEEKKHQARHAQFFFR